MRDADDPARALELDASLYSVLRGRVDQVKDFARRNGVYYPMLIATGSTAAAFGVFVIWRAARIRLRGYVFVPGC